MATETEARLDMLEAICLAMLRRLPDEERDAVMDAAMVQLGEDTPAGELASIMALECREPTGPVSEAVITILSRQRSLRISAGWVEA